MALLMVPHLGPVAVKLLRARYPTRAPAVDAATLSALLAKAKAGAHKPAIAFEKAYGGLSFPEAGCGRDWRKSGDEPWLVGPAACLASGESFHPPGPARLVPVLATANDNVYFLDGKGAAWAQDTIEDAEPVLFAPDMRAMLSRILLAEHVFLCPAEKTSKLPGARGAKIAKALKLRALADASDASERWWTDGKVFVVEHSPADGGARTTIAFASKSALAKTGSAPPAIEAPVAGPVTFDTVLREGSPISIVVPIDAMTPDAAFRAFFDPTKHGRVCAFERRAGGAVSLADGRFTGAILEIAETDPSAIRVQLQLEAGKDGSRKTSRVELFFRAVTTTRTLMNIFQFDVKDSRCAEVRRVWDEDILDSWRPKT